MRKKKGPPYEDDPECQYVIIENPWYPKMQEIQSTGYPRKDLKYLNWIAVWLSYMFEPRQWPDELYYVSTVRSHRHQ